jgi:tetratricopeptide (TPR) repeat protein
MGLVLARNRRHSRDRRQFSSVLRRIWPALLLSTALPWTAVAAEPVEEFVKGLQNRGQHELALEYLEQLKTSPLADEAVRRQIPYLRGVALVVQSRQSPDPTLRNKLLDEARQELEQFAASNPHNVQGAEAQLQLGTVQMSRGQELVAQIAQLPKNAAYDAQRKTVGREARVMFAEARDTFKRAEEIYSVELERLPPTLSSEAHGDTGSKRQEYRGRVAQLQFLRAQTQFEEAQSYPPEADEFRKLNETAAQELSAVYDEFSRTLLVGLYARLYEGRCYQAVGEYQLALGCYEELIGKDNVLPPFRKLIADAIGHKAEVFIAQEQYDAAITACRACLKDAHKDEATQPEWLGVRFCLAEALSKKSESARDDSLEKRRLIVEAHDAYRTVAKSPGEYQIAARTAAAVARGETKSGGKDKEEPKSFQAAYELGKDALASYNTAKMAIPTAENNNPPAVPELKAQMISGKEDARHYFGLAMSLVDADTDPKLLNEVRYFLCWLYWDSEDYYRAAVLGEFLAKRYPDHPAASSAAKIAMASFERLYNVALSTNGKHNNGDFETQHMADMAQLITRRWPGTEDADAAFGVLVSCAIRGGRIEDAEKLVSQASTQSRPRLDLQLGSAMWARYLELSQTDEGTSSDSAALDKLKSAAVKHLRSGFEAARKESTVSELAATASLYLVQSLLDDGKYADAIDLLQDGKVGPLKLIEVEHPTALRPQYAVEAYKAALRAYVSVSPPQEQKAIETMRALERVVKASNGERQAAEQLNRIYIGMGVALAKQIESLRAVGQEQEAMRVSAAVAKFLDRINLQQSTSNWATRVWLAQMYYMMAIDKDAASQQPGPPPPPKPLSAASRSYLVKSRDAYQQLLKEAATNSKLPPNDTAVLAAKMQLGECYRALGQLQEALDAFADVLKEKEASLAVQRIAALTYQERGQRDDPKFFESAIHGGYKQPNGQERVWGWLKISTVAARAARSDARFRDAFYEARYNIGRCRYSAAMKKLGDARSKDLTTAKEGIQSFERLYPDMGGEKWKPEFEKLQAQINAALKLDER